jgi:heme A synthase
MTTKRFERYIWIVLGYTIIVILWGAFVRATGSGAGCGNHWPLCNGEVIPREPLLETIIEISHRLTSGLLLIMIVVLTFFSFRLYPKGHIVRRGGVLTLVFVIIEALFGAALVLLELVAHNASLTRAFSTSLHLVNTLVLVGAITLTGMWARGIAAPDFKGRGRMLTWIIIGVMMTLLLGASGGIAALGDTLFPVTTFAEGLAQDFDMTANVLLRLRVLHPVIAIATGIVMVVVSQVIAQMNPVAGTRKASRVLLAAYVGQLALGTINMVLLAPIPIQLLHLLLADVIWIAFVVLVGLALQRESRPA